MSNRINELAEHCDFYVGNEHYNKSHEEKQVLWTEKLAEMIIEECVDIMYKQERLPPGYFYSKPAHIHEYAIKEHFGILK